MTPLLEAEHLVKTYPAGRDGLLGWRSRRLRALDDVSLSVGPGEAVGVVGESGCGKSTLGRALLRLHDVDRGTIRFEGTDITRAGDRSLRRVRARMQMVFQDPYASLNPRRRIGDLVAEPLRVHGRSGVAERVRTLIETVGLAPHHLDRFPHEFSGGQRQRIGIARALALEPRLIVADEPVSALDVSVQAQIVNLFADLREHLGLAYLFIAHDLSVVRQISDRVAVMYLGAIVEAGPTDLVLHRPAHHYTAALLAAVPGGGRDRVVLGGDPPSPISPPSGCRFRTRCGRAEARCASERPALTGLGDGRDVACHFPL